MSSPQAFCSSHANYSKGWGCRTGFSSLLPCHFIPKALGGQSHWGLFRGAACGIAALIVNTTPQETQNNNRWGINEQPGNDMQRGIVRLCACYRHHDYWPILPRSSPLWMDPTTGRFTHIIHNGLPNAVFVVWQQCPQVFLLVYNSEGFYWHHWKSLRIQKTFHPF